MDRQAVLSAVVAHARKQNARARGHTRFGTTCVYRSEEGMKCFIGCLIPDELYNPLLEGEGVTSEAMEPFLEYLKVDTQADKNFLHELQMIHDMDEPSRWESRFKEFADRYSLLTF